ncbi:UdgX family uracil-DNA binding protein [Palleronia caenipelagi]|uniref:Type-4 uracil-DNA glycosylase n=1 Tax=Palleronia caenipelagi TaxID=2489174 RepID=A0A547Q9K6_9RHOB|nr:UdgX family uracil-DNA binding protein [Palleronia caenipelagi]TRD23073.1 UdgX family uracil-DNA binding protein [Palleronia caenipelagi]
MHRVEIPEIGTRQAWRDAARGLLVAGIPPAEVFWDYAGTGTDLFAHTPPPAARGEIAVPQSFVALADSVCWHRDPERFARLYALLWRLRTERGLMADRADQDLARLRNMEKAVRRDSHKMKAFVRFREIDPIGTRRRFAAWFEPDHHIVEPLSGFFMRRFGDMDWVIMTPDRTAIFCDGAVRFDAGQSKPPLPEDATEALWSTYFRNIFNPARLKTKAMQSEMPKKYWKNLPEAAAIPELIATAEARAREMQAAAPSLAPARAARIAERLPERADPDALNACTRCPLFCNATQAVPGEGPSDARVMIVGEQPGDQEDLAGRPFVGPAGQLFDQIAGEAGLERSSAYVTNAVKHFKFTPRGKRRIHQRPNISEVQACKWWLDAEIAQVRPGLIVAMGSTAAQSLTGCGAGLKARQGQIEQTPEGTPVLITWHPSYLLRLADASGRMEATNEMRRDLTIAAQYQQEIS